MLGGLIQINMALPDRGMMITIILIKETRP
jgi:hypothetical protein